MKLLNSFPHLLMQNLDFAELFFSVACPCLGTILGKESYHGVRKKK